MKHIAKIRSILSGVTLGAVVLVSSANVFAAPSSKGLTPPSTSFASGVQAKPPVAPGSVDAKATASLGSTKMVKTDASGKLTTSSSVTPLAGVVSGVDFQTFYNYCSKNLVYTTVNNTTSVTKYIHVQLYNQGSYRDYYTSIAAGGSYSYPAFYGVDGSYYAYLYVWDGSSYVYDEYKAGTNTCNVSVTRTYNTSGWVQLKIQNLGTAYATQASTELAPFPAYDTYTGGAHYDYPAAGGAAIYRWFYVGTSPYGIASNTYGSSNMPAYFYGDL